MARSRTERRRLDRQAVKDAEQRLKVASLLPGGSPSHPITIATSHLVEVEAIASPCVVCGGALRCDEHVVEYHAGASLRVARIRCTECRVRRNVYFSVSVPS